jgi:bacteriophage exclusion system BrxC/D-like protein
MKIMISPQRRREIIDALRRGTVPMRSLDAFAVGLNRFQTALDDELNTVRVGGSVFKAVRGEYGSGKTFFARWLQERARQSGFAAAEVQISETETPLHRLETVYRRMMERLSTADTEQGAFRTIIDGWFYTLEEDVIASGRADASDAEKLLQLTTDLMEQRLAAITRTAPTFAAALRGYRQAGTNGDTMTADGLLAWIAGQPNVAASIKRAANIKGDVDHYGALSFLQGLLTVLRDSGRAGLLLVLDEVETLQRVRGDVREKGLNALRQLIDEIDAGRFSGLYLLITGTPSFYDSPQGIQKLPPLAQRLQVDFSTDARFDNPRAIQIRLPGFTLDSLVEVGIRVREIFCAHSSEAGRITTIADRDYIEQLARAIAGNFGDRVGVAPRVFLKKLVGDILDRIEQFTDFDPRLHYALTVSPSELNEIECNALSAENVDEIELEL